MFHARRSDRPSVPDGPPARTPEGRSTRYLSAAGLAARAVDEVGRGSRLWHEHQHGRDGLCTGCGHAYPCAGAMEAAWLVMWWTPWLPQPEIARPYVDGAPADRIAPGQVLRLTPENAMYQREPCRFRVREVRPDLARSYRGELVWLVGDVLDDDGTVRETDRPALVRIAAFR